jgi:hypothetical protein
MNATAFLLITSVVNFTNIKFINEVLTNIYINMFFQFLIRQKNNSILKKVGVKRKHSFLWYEIYG